VTSLALAKALAREREVSVLSALGATRRQVATQLLVESVLLAVIAGIAGSAVAVLGTPALAGFIPPGVPRVSNVRVDGPVLLFALAISIAAGLVAGLTPAAWAFRGSFQDVLRRSRGTAVPVRQRTFAALLIAQVSVTFVLLVGAILVSRSYVALLQVDVGYDPQNVLTLSTRLWGRPYGDPVHAQEYYRRVLERVRAVPGVQEAAFTSAIPMDTPTRWAFQLADAPVEDAAAPTALEYSVTPEYFRVMRIPLVTGRTVTNADTPGSPPVVIVNATFARLNYGSPGNAIGRRLKFEELRGKRPWVTIVGVVGDVHHGSLS
jgi:putative ABC transport system permease protein